MVTASNRAPFGHFGDVDDPLFRGVGQSDEVVGKNGRLGRENRPRAREDVDGIRMSDGRGRR